MSALKKGGDVDVEAMPAFPRLSLRVRGSASWAAFEALSAEIAGVERPGRLVLRCSSVDGLVQALAVLNFATERLEFEPSPDQIFVGQDGSLKAVQYALDAAAMLRGLLLNGQFEIWNAESGELLGRIDPYIPMNIDLGRSIKHIDSWIAELQATEQRLLGASAAAAPAPDREASPPS